MHRKIKLFYYLLIMLMVVSACSAKTDNTESQNTDKKYITYTDNYKEVEIPVNPQTVVVLDNRIFETLASWDIKLAAVPKSVMIEDSPYVLDETVLDIGNHREPQLEVIAAVDPDLVIVGQRFTGFYDDIVKLVPNAVVIDINIDVSETADSSGNNLKNGFIEVTNLLGQIFEKDTLAKELINDFETSIEKAKVAYNETDTVLSVIVSGGNIGYSAPKTGRVWGPLYEILGLISPLDVNNTTTDHQGDEISVEAIAQANPDWLFVLDRDAAVSSEDSVPAQDVIDNSPALKNVTAIIEGNILYAPNDTYTNESIQTFIKIFNLIAEAFSD